MDDNQHKVETGRAGEDQAAIYLEKKGYRILERNYRHGRGEVDIICQKPETLVFVEVKTRKNQDFGPPESFVSERKEELFHDVAGHYLETLGWEKDVRFDVIAITNRTGELRHFEDAFF